MPRAAQQRDRSMQYVSEYPLTGDDGQRVPNHTVKLLGPIERLPGVVTVANPDGKTRWSNSTISIVRIAASPPPTSPTWSILDPQLKLVLVPFPVLGAASIAASRVELAVAKLGTPQQFYDFHRKIYAQRGVTDGSARARRRRARLGFRRTRLDHARRQRRDHARR